MSLNLTSAFFFNEGTHPTQFYNLPLHQNHLHSVFPEPQIKVSEETITRLEKVEEKAGIPKKRSHSSLVDYCQPLRNWRLPTTDPQHQNRKVTIASIFPSILNRKPRRVAAYSFKAVPLSNDEKQRLRLWRLTLFPEIKKSLTNIRGNPTHTPFNDFGLWVYLAFKNISAPSIKETEFLKNFHQYVTPDNLKKLFAEIKNFSSETKDSLLENFQHIGLGYSYSKIFYIANRVAIFNLYEGARHQARAWVQKYADNLKYD